MIFSSFTGIQTITKIVSNLDVAFLLLSFIILCICVGLLTHLKFITTKIFVILTIYSYGLFIVLFVNNTNSIISSASSLLMTIFSFFAVFFLMAFHTYLKKDYVKVQNGYVLLLLLSLLGMSTVLLSEDLFFWFLGIELQSFSFYALCAYQTNRAFLQTQAALKYFVFGSIASSFLLYGLSLLFIETSSLQIADIQTILLTNQDSTQIKIAITLIIIAIFIKIGCAPFHMWTPQVYTNSATILTFFFLLLPKIPLFYILYILSTLQIENIYTFVIIVSLLIGTIYAFSSQNFKTFMAYSAIANNAFLLTPLLTNSAITLYALISYLVMYNIVLISIFAVILFVRRYDGTPLINNLRDLALLKKTNLFLAIGLAIAFLNFSGIPPLLGFSAKLLVLSASLSESFYSINVFLLIASLLSSYYYLRVLKTMFFPFGLKFAGINGIPKTISYLVSGSLVLNIAYFLTPISTLIFPELNVYIWDPIQIYVYAKYGRFFGGGI